MKTISGHCLSVKDISLSKAAKILSKFVSADNGASHVINAYLHRASASFNELNQLHRELGSSHSHRKHKRHQTEMDNDSRRVVANSVQNVDIELVSDREGNEEVQVNPGMEEGRRQKSAKKHKVSTSRFFTCKDEVENGKGLEQLQKETEKKLCNGLESENGVLDGSLDVQIKKKKKYKKGSENKLYTEEVKLEQSKNRNSDTVEGRPEDLTGDLTKNKTKKKISGDI